MPRTKKTTDEAQPIVQKTAVKNGQWLSHGRRKRAVARVRLFSGTGKIVVNDKPVQEYFSGKTAQVLYQKPFVLTDTVGKFDVTVKVLGSGTSGQLGAVIHGISRALISLNPKDFRPILKKAGLLTRDPREKERRKYGLAGKARKRKQSPKR